jgi:hypothetical protein
MQHLVVATAVALWLIADHTSTDRVIAVRTASANGPISTRTSTNAGATPRESCICTKRSKE